MEQSILVMDGTQWDLANLTDTASSSLRRSSLDADEEEPDDVSSLGSCSYVESGGGDMDRGFVASSSTTTNNNNNTRKHPPAAVSAFYPSTKDIPECLNINDLFAKLEDSSMIKRVGRVANPQLVHLSSHSSSSPTITNRNEVERSYRRHADTAAAAAAADQPHHSSTAPASRQMPMPQPPLRTPSMPSRGQQQHQQQQQYQYQYQDREEQDRFSQQHSRDHDYDHDLDSFDSSHHRRELLLRHREEQDEIARRQQREKEDFSIRTRAERENRQRSSGDNNHNTSSRVMRYPADEALWEKETDDGPRDLHYQRSSSSYRDAYSRAAPDGPQHYRWDSGRSSNECQPPQAYNHNSREEERLDRNRATVEHGYSSSGYGRENEKRNRSRRSVEQQYTTGGREDQTMGKSDGDFGHSRHFPPRHSNRAPEQNNRASRNYYEADHSEDESEGGIQKQTMVEVTPDNYVPLIGSAQTWEAIQEGRIAHTTCFACMEKLVCINLADIIMCPECRMISPVMDESNSSIKGGGLGLGMKESDALEELSRLRGDQMQLSSQYEDRQQQGLYR